MIISHRKKFVVLAPWKAANSAMRTRLGPFCNSPYPIFPDFNPHLARIATRHMTRADFEALPESRLGYFSAAFVRNPYDRAYSCFRQSHRDMKVLQHMPYAEPWIRDYVLKFLGEIERQLTRSSFDFDNWIASLDVCQVRDAGRNICFPLHPAHYWTHLNGVRAVDFIGKVENFENDFVSLCARLGIESPGRTGIDVGDAATSLPHPAGYYKYVHLMKPVTLARIGDLFHEDFALFDYPRIA